MDVLAIMGGLGGILLLLTTIIVIGRGIFRQVNATEENTAAVRELAASVAELKNMYNDLNTRMAVLEDRIKR